ncbi:MAG: 50S ribosomal protein L11 methyltransferase [Bacteroidota bacterium]
MTSALNYTLLKLHTANPETQEILIALLSDIGFDGFLQEDDFITAYMSEEQFRNTISENTLDELLHPFNIKLDISSMADKNWNELWEKSFSPVLVDDQVIIRADFHKPPAGIKHDIIINPRMAFGTGHHDTTYMMVKYMLGIHFNDTEVLDFGCGTGILSILASRLGARHIVAIDHDVNACLNTQDNLTQNLIINCTVKHGELEVASGQQDNVILANINRNVILANMASLYNLLLPNGCILISGILKTDAELIIKAATELGWVMTGTLQTDQWVALCYKKINS